MGTTFPVCGPNKRNSDSVSESGSGKVEAPFLGLFLEKPAMLLPVTAPMPSRKQCNKMSFKKGVWIWLLLVARGIKQFLHVKNNFNFNRKRERILRNFRCHIFNTSEKCSVVKHLPLIIQNALQPLFDCGPISGVLKTTTRGAFSEPRNGSQRHVCQITNACSITLTCQKMVINIAVGRRGLLGNSPKLLGQTGCRPSQRLVVSPYPL